MWVSPFASALVEIVFNQIDGSVLVAGVAGLFAGAMPMAAGEYVAVHSQADTEQATSILSARSSRRTTKESTLSGKGIFKYISS